MGAVSKVLIGVVVIIVLVGVVANQIAEGEKHTITGDVVLQGADSFYAESGRCIGDGGFSDIIFGAKVTVRNEKNELIASGDLKMGMNEITRCRFSFEITDVPKAEFYQFMVTHRGAPTMTHDDMERSNWTVSFSLGR